MDGNSNNWEVVEEFRNAEAGVVVRVTRFTGEARPDKPPLHSISVGRDTGPGRVSYHLHCKTAHRTGDTGPSLTVDLAAVLLPLVQAAQERVQRDVTAWHAAHPSSRPSRR